MTNDERLACERDVAQQFAAHLRARANQEDAIAEWCLASGNELSGLRCSKAASVLREEAAAILKEYAR